MNQMEGQSFRGPGDLRFDRQANESVEKAKGIFFQINGQTYSKNQMYELICQEISTGKSLPEICRIPGFPSARMVAGWMRNEPVFKKAFEEAEEVRAIFLAEEVIERADSADKETAAAVKIQVESRKWMAGKLNKKYSDRQIHEHLHELELKNEDELRAILIAGIESSPKILNGLDPQVLESIGLKQTSLTQDCVNVESSLSEEVPVVEVVEDDD